MAEICSERPTIVENFFCCSSVISMLVRFFCIETKFIVIMANCMKCDSDGLSLRGNTVFKNICCFAKKSRLNEN